MRPALAFAASAVVFLMAAMTASTAEPAKGNAFDHEFEAIEGGKLPLSKWRGKVLLVVNTASFCGFTRQYEGLQKLWERYEGKGLVVVGVPSNDFGWQEPKSESEILSFCQGAFNVTFPLTNKQSVRGSGAHPFYRWAREALGPQRHAAVELLQVSGGAGRQADRWLRVDSRAAVRRHDGRHRGGAGETLIRPYKKQRAHPGPRLRLAWSDTQAAWPIDVSWLLAAKRCCSATRRSAVFKSGAVPVAAQGSV